MFEFIKYLIKQYKINKMVNEVQQKIQNMRLELNKDHKLTKYKNPGQIWAKLQWELFLAKRGFKDGKTYYASLKKK